MNNFKHQKYHALEVQEASMDTKPLFEFLESIPGGSNILTFILGVSIPSICIYLVASKLLPTLTSSVSNFSKTLNTLAVDIGLLSRDITRTCDSISDYSNNLRITSEKATAAFASINNGLVLTNQHIANLDTSLDVVKNAVNQNHYTLDGVSYDVKEVKEDIKFISREIT